MRNLLFYTSAKITPTIGGTEHTTLTVAEGLKSTYGCKCWSVYDEAASAPNLAVFENQILLPRKGRVVFLKDIILSNKIDCILVEGNFSFVEVARKSIAGLNDVKLIFVHHFSPGWECQSITFRKTLRNIMYIPNKRNWQSFIKLILFPIYKYYVFRQSRRLYNKVYKASDKIILLSQKYISPYKIYAKLDEDSKFVGIPNPLTYSESFNVDKLVDKKKQVLMVSRLEETQKRISLGLKIWKSIKDDPRSEGWSLIIVGDGECKEMYKNYVDDYRIKDVSFVGQVSPLVFYKESSLFIMTSKSEGFPLTINEALQNGCVPLVFDTFETLEEMVVNGESGYIIPEGEVEVYISKMLELMGDDKMRNQFASNGIRLCQKYSSQYVVPMWWRMLNEL